MRPDDRRFHLSIDEVGLALQLPRRFAAGRQTNLDSMKFLKPLSPGQRLGWYFASLIYGICVVAIAHGSLDELDVLWDEEPWVIVAVHALAWLVGVVLLRVYVQDKDPTDFVDIVGLKRKRRSGD